MVYGSQTLLCARNTFLSNLSYSAFSCGEHKRLFLEMFHGTSVSRWRHIFSIYLLWICAFAVAASITFDFPADKNRFSLIVQVLHWVYWSALFVHMTYGKISRKLRRFQKTRNWLNQIWKHIYSDSAGLVECKGYFKELSVFESQGRVKEKDQRRIKRSKYIQMHFNHLK